MHLNAMILYFGSYKTYLEAFPTSHTQAALNQLN